MDLVPANSVTFELVYITAQRCECGGTYRPESQRLLTVNDFPVDRVSTTCTRCGSQRDFFFDIHGFYGQEKDDHFASVEEILQEALAAMRSQRWDAAEAKLRQVIDPVEGEPAFGWAHYHLGMVLLVKERHTEGLEHVQRAVALTPREAEFYRGLSKAWALVGREDESQAALARYKTLRDKQTDELHFIPDASETCSDKS